MKTRTYLSLAALLASLAHAAPAGAQHEAAARVDAARRAYDLALAGLGTGATPEDVYLWSARWLASERAATPARSPEHLRAHVARMEALRDRVRAQVAAGTMPALAEAACAYYALEARAWLARPPP